MPEIKPLSTIREVSQEHDYRTATDSTQGLYGFDPRGDQAGNGSNEGRESSYEQTSPTGRDYTKEYYGIKPSDDPEAAAQRRSDWMRAYDQLTQTSRGSYPRGIRPDESRVISPQEANVWEHEGIREAFREYAEKHNLTILSEVQKKRKE